MQDIADASPATRRTATYQRMAIPRLATPAVVQRLLEPDENLAGLSLEGATAATLIHDAEEDGGVYRVTVGGVSYIVKGTSEGAAAEVAATRMAALLGITAANLATRDISEEEADAVNAFLDDETELEEGTVVIMQDLGGQSLDHVVEDGIVGLTGHQGFDMPRFLEQMGELATADLLIGIGDRFNITEMGQANVNFGNIIVRADGSLAGIDYDPAQGAMAGQNRAPIVAYARQTLADTAAVVALVRGAIASDLEGLVLPDDADDHIAVGVERVVARIRDLSAEDLQSIRDEANVAMAGYGTFLYGIAHDL